jgi:plastocyanin
MLRTHLAAVLAVGVLLVAGCSASRPAARTSTSMPMASASVTAPAAPVSGTQVNIDGFAFVPATLTVSTGTTVTWTNRDEEPHTVAASDGSFHSPGMGTGATYTHTFGTAGTFDYVCSIHPMMHGTVVVTG